VAKSKLTLPVQPIAFSSVGEMWGAVMASSMVVASTGGS